MAADDFRGSAVTAAMAASPVLAALGARVPTAGALARGGFGSAPDIDCPVVECPRHPGHAVETAVGDGRVTVRGGVSPPIRARPPVL